MTYEEAIEWIKGERSPTNIIPQRCGVSYCKTCGTNCTLKGRDVVVVCSDYVQTAQPTVPGWYWVKLGTQEHPIYLSHENIQDKIFSFICQQGVRFDQCQFASCPNPFKKGV